MDFVVCKVAVNCMGQKNADCIVENSAVFIYVAVCDVDILCGCGNNKITVDENSVCADAVEQTARYITVL